MLILLFRWENLLRRMFFPTSYFCLVKKLRVWILGFWFVVYISISQMPGLVPLTGPKKLTTGPKIDLSNLLETDENQSKLKKNVYLTKNKPDPDRTCLKAVSFTKGNYI